MFAKLTNGKVAQYPYTVGDLRRDNPNVSFPKTVPTSVMARYGMVPVGYEAAPDYDPMTQRIQHSNMPERETLGTYTEDDAPMPELVGEPIYSGRWVLTKTVVDLTDEEIAARLTAKEAEVRKERDKLIAETDWWVLPDRTATDEQLAYRQALRDISSQEGFPYNVTWPTKPGV